MFLHTVGSLSVDRGGPSRTVSSLVDSLANAGVAVGLVSTADSGVSQMRCLPSTTSSFIAISDDQGLRGKCGFEFYLALSKSNKVKRTSAVHDHGIWEPTNFWAAYFARKVGIPLFLSPRGMLEPWSLGQKRLKKSLAMVAYQRRILEQVKVFFATSVAEADSIRRLGLRQPVAIIPNGVVVSAHHRILQTSKVDRTRSILFLSRIHQKKGLINLVQAWSTIPIAGWNLIIAGNDDGGHEALIRREVERLGLADSVRFVGAVEGRRKEELFTGADLFILPTFSENFGVVVAEALSYGVPVITTTGAPWRELSEYRCGWWVAPKLEAIRAALIDGMQRTDGQRYEMGLRGRRLVADRYSWNSIGRSTMAVYDWALGKGPRPDCVVV